MQDKLLKTIQVKRYTASHIDIIIHVYVERMIFHRGLSVFGSEMMKLLLAVASLQMLLAPVFMVSADARNDISEMIN